jgi:tetratricopeptide (TPR) repeat protein
MALALTLTAPAVRAQGPDVAALNAAAGSAVDRAEFDTDKSRQTALYAEALRYARQSVAAAPNAAEGHFHVARSLGRTALAAPARDRVRLSVEVRAATLTALRLDPDHPGALHVLGMWNAEVMRLNAVTRALAKNFMGGEELGQASWNEAVRLLERAVALEPARIVHRLDLALVYRDVGRDDAARAQLDWIAKAPATDFNDPHYKRTAADARRRMR